MADNNEEELKKIDFAPIINVLKQLKVKKSLNLLEWSDPFFNEVHQSAAIAWLFSREASHEKAAFFQKSFLIFIKDHAISFEKDSATGEEGTAHDKEGFNPESPYATRLDKLIEKISEKPLTCEREFSIDGGRVDICLDNGRFLIENKPFSSEGDKQLERYAKYAKNNDGIVLFLCNRKSDSCTTEELKPLCARLSYDRLAQWLECASDDLLSENKWLTNESTFADLKDRFSLVNYLKHLAAKVGENKMEDAKLTKEQIKIFIDNWDALQNFEAARQAFHYQLIEQFVGKMKKELNDERWEYKLDLKEKIGKNFFGFDFKFADKFCVSYEFQKPFLHNLCYGLSKRQGDWLGETKIEDFGEYCRKNMVKEGWESNKYWMLWKWKEQPRNFDDPRRIDENINIKELVKVANDFKDMYGKYQKK